ncbi:hypothetical protein NIES2109_63040 (plasmid) [Nostoc sp. HK-01]|nr:hypothetical protein NIES2109_63040 [Nostoc sp. HK-01]
MPRKPSLPTVARGIFQTPANREIELEADWDDWQDWLMNAESFRYCPMSSEPAYTMRKEQGTKGQGSYWYAYRKQSGNLAKCYVGLDEGLTIENLEAVAKQLTEKLKRKVTKSVSVTNSLVTDRGAVTKDDEIEKLQKENKKLHRQVKQLQRQLQIALGKPVV